MKYNPDVGMTSDECATKHEGTVKYFATLPKNLAKMRIYRLELEDIISVGNYGLMKAYENFNKDTKATWKSYAENTVNFHIKNFFNQMGNGIVSVPTDIRKLYNKIKYNPVYLDEEGKIKLSAEEIAIELSCSISVAESVLQCEYADEVVKTAYSQNDEEHTKKLAIKASKNRKFFSSSVEEEIIFQDIINHMNERERIVIEKKLEGYSIREIANFIGLGRQTVANTLGNIEKKIKEYYKLNDINVERNKKRIYQRCKVG